MREMSLSPALKISEMEMALTMMLMLMQYSMANSQVRLKLSSSYIRVWMVPAEAMKLREMM